jgi:hypothetical protein
MDFTAEIMQSECNAIMSVLSEKWVQCDHYGIPPPPVCMMSVTWSLWVSCLCKVSAMWLLWALCLSTSVMWSLHAYCLCVVSVMWSLWVHCLHRLRVTWSLQAYCVCSVNVMWLIWVCSLLHLFWNGCVCARLLRGLEFLLKLGSENKYFKVICCILWK